MRAKVKVAEDDQFSAIKMTIALFSSKELIAFKELSKILLGLSPEEIEIAIKNKDLIEVEK